MQSATINGIALHYHWQPAGPGLPILVFVNSLGTDLRIWDEVRGLIGASASILTYDKRGHGLSDLGMIPHSLDDHVGDLAGLLDHLAISSAVICGLSIGGLIAQRIATVHPQRVRALILCDTAMKIGTAESWNSRIETVSSGGLAAVVEGVMARWFTPAYRSQSNSQFAVARNMFLRQSPKGYAASCVTVRDADLRAQATSIKAPVLCVVGDQDGATPPDLVEELSKAISGSRFEVIGKCGHIPCLEQPRVLYGLIARFLGKLGSEKNNG